MGRFNEKIPHTGDKESLERCKPGLRDFSQKKYGGEGRGEALFPLDLLCSPGTRTLEGGHNIDIATTRKNQPRADSLKNYTTKTLPTFKRRDFFFSFVSKVSILQCSRLPGQADIEFDIDAWTLSM